MPKHWSGMTLLCLQLTKIEINGFFQGESPSGDFPVGYITKRGNSKRWIEQPADLSSMYRQFESGDTITFFCDGKAGESK